MDPNIRARLTSPCRWSTGQEALCLTIALTLGTPFFVVFGRLSDRYGRQPIIVAGLVLAALTFLPLYAWMKAAAGDHRYAQVVIAVLLQIVFSEMIYGPMAAYLTELFPPQIRYTGLSISYHLGAGLFGGFTLLIALSLTSSTGNQLAGVAYPIVVAALSALVSVTLLRNGRKNRSVSGVWDRFDRTEAAPSLETPAGT